MQLKILHQFTKDQAIQKVKVALLKGRQQIGEQATVDEERWEGDTLHFGFTAQKQSISGTLTVLDKEFDLYVKLPLMLRMFEGRIKSAIEQQAKGLLG